MFYMSSFGDSFGNVDVPASVRGLSDGVQGPELGRDVAVFARVRCPTVRAFPAVSPAPAHGVAPPPDDASRAPELSPTVRPGGVVRPPAAFVSSPLRGPSACKSAVRQMSGKTYKYYYI